MEIEVDTELIREQEKRHRANIFDDLLGLLNEQGEVTLKRVDKIPVVSDEGEMEHWPFKIVEIEEMKIDPFGFQGHKPYGIEKCDEIRQKLRAGKKVLLTVEEESDQKDARWDHDRRR